MRPILGIMSIVSVLLAAAIWIANDANTEEKTSVQSSKEVYMMQGSIILNGNISEQNVNQIINMYVERKENIPYLVLQSNGGDITDGVRLEKFVKMTGISVYVPNYCHSACTLAFFAAKKKDMSQTAIMSLHNLSVQVENKDISKVSTAEVDRVAKLVAENSAHVMILYAKAGIPLTVLDNVATSFGPVTVDLTRKEMVKWKILPSEPAFG